MSRSTPYLIAIITSLILSALALAYPPPGGGGGGSTPPPNPEIAFADSGIKVMNADGTNIRTVVRLRGGEYARAPAWSPDGTQIVFWGRIGGQLGIHVVPIAAGPTRFVTPASSLLTFPDWSPVPAPDGQFKIVFADDNPVTSDRDIFIVNVDGSGRMNLTNTPQVWEGSAAWASDGRRLVVERGETTSPPPDMAMLHLDIVGGSIGVVGESVILASVDVSTPRWANQSEALVFGLWTGSVRRVALLDLSSGGALPVLLTSQSAFDERYPSFSPDDSRVAFQRTGQGGGIFTINADGTGEMRINARGTDPNWKR